MSEVFYQKSGAGNSIICFHGSLASSRQWQSLTEKISDRYEVFCPDLYGYGKSPAWLSKRVMTVDDELNLLDPVFQATNDQLNLIGHS